MDRQSRRHPSASVRQKRPAGFFLIWVLLMIGFMSSLMALGQIRSNTELIATNRFVGNETAFQLAEAGLDHALSVMKTSSLKWDDELLGQDGNPNTADDGLLSFGQTVSLADGNYAVRVLDNQDERAPTPDDPMTDADGIVRVVSVGAMTMGQRTIEAIIRSLFDFAIAAQVDIVLRQPSVMGNIHANHDILVDQQPTTLFGCSYATATGIVDQSKASLTYDPSCGGVRSGQSPIGFPRPDEATLRAAIKPANWNLPNTTATILLPSQEVVGYDMALDALPNTPKTIKFSAGDGPSTMVVFGHSLRIRESLGTFQTVGGNTFCTAPLNLSIVVLGGSIDFKQAACLRGLVWADGDITIAQGSSISGAIVSAGGTIDVKQSSAVSFNRAAISSALLPGFSGFTLLSWEEQ